MVTSGEKLTAVICRRAQEISGELEGYSIETHQAIVSTLATLFQHRGLMEQRRLQQQSHDAHPAKIEVPQ